MFHWLQRVRHFKPVLVAQRWLNLFQGYPIPQGLSTPSRPEGRGLNPTFLVKGQASAEFSLSLVQHHQWKQRQSRTRGHQGFFPGPIRSCRRVGMESLRMEEEPFVVSPHARAQVSVLLERGWTTAGFWCKRTEVFPLEECPPQEPLQGWQSLHWRVLPAWKKFSRFG